MLAASALQTSVNAYRDAGLPDESKRVRVLMEEKIGLAKDEMVPVETSFTIPMDDMEALFSLVLFSTI